MEIVLTEEQKIIVNHSSTAHARIIAGPGTGKSATAIALAQQLAKTNSNIRLKFLTFTRSATAELVKKLDLVSASSKATFAPSTVHSFAISFLLQNPNSANFPVPLRLAGDSVNELLIKDFSGRFRIPIKKVKILIREMAAKWESLAPEEHPAISLTERSRFLGAWSEHSAIFGHTLVQELPDLMRQALRDHENLKGLDYKVLIVDEYQDLNACDLAVIRALESRGISIIAIGDDDQSIYSFRKAHPAGIREFLSQFQNSKDYTLTVCHRSPKNLLDWAEFVINGDTKWPTKKALECGNKNNIGTDLPPENSAIA